MWHIFKINFFYICSNLNRTPAFRNIEWSIFKLLSFESCKIISLTSDDSTFAFLLNDSSKQYVYPIHVSFLFSISGLLVCWYLWILEEGIVFPRIKIASCCVQFKMGAWKWNIGVSEEHWHWTYNLWY